MGKYMKKARGGGGVLEVMAQGSLGVRTRARAQAMQKELIRSNSSNTKMHTSTSMRSFISPQISYLELRSRRLEKVVCSMSNKLPSSRKSTSAVECRGLSDSTTPDILADDNTPSRMALSEDEARQTRRQSRNQIFDDFVCHFHGGNDNEAEEESLLQGFVQKSLQQWTSRGRTPPGAALSRSNSRSNSVTRELPPQTQELPPRGILTRNQRKLEKQTSTANACSYVDKYASCNAKAYGLMKTFDAEVSFGENPTEEVWSAGNRHAHEGTPSGNSKELQPTTINRDQTPQPTVHSSFNMEIEDFFLQAERQVQRSFIERYNFDPQNDTPLPGRYNWIEL